MNEIHTSIAKLPESVRDKWILRTVIMAEYDAINMYKELAALTTDERIKKVLEEVAEEEQVHVGEFEKVLTLLDKDHKENKVKGALEVLKMLALKHSD